MQRYNIFMNKKRKENGGDNEYVYFFFQNESMNYLRIRTVYIHNHLDVDLCTYYRKITIFFLLKYFVHTLYQLLTCVIFKKNLQYIYIYSDLICRYLYSFLF